MKGYIHFKKYKYMKRYRKKLIVYSIICTTICFTIAIPAALWTITLISSKGQPQAGNVMLRKMGKNSQAVLFMNKIP